MRRRAASRRRGLKMRGGGGGGAASAIEAPCRAWAERASVLPEEGVGSTLPLMGVMQRLGQSLAPVVDLVFPPRCPLCGAGLAAQNGLCAQCWGTLAIPGDPACQLCNRPIGSDSLQEGAVCAPCMAQAPQHAGIAAATLYNPASRKLVLAFKHGRRIALAPMMARLIAARLPEKVGPEWLIVPVPLHRWRLWRRGYNQSALLAREMAKLNRGTVCIDALLRKKATPSLGGLGRTARHKVMSGAIEVLSQRKAQIKGARVLLVDDVLTSGATTGACVSALKRAGAKEVVIGCFARVVDETT